MYPTLALALAGTLLGCGPKEPPPEPMTVEPGAAPILPSPTSSTYALGETRPRDPLVAEVVGDRLPWRESLAGAATALVLDGGPPYSLESAQWAAVRAGYPHPVVTILVGDEIKGTIPEELPGAVARQVGPGDHVGVVRGRVDEVDRWVVLVGDPLVSDASALASFPRELAEGGPLTIPLTGASWQLVSPTGAIRSGAGPTTGNLDEGGEWWFELFSGEQRVLALPLFVGMPSPEEPLLALPGIPASSEEEVLDQALDALAQLRADFELAPLEVDATLGTLAKQPLGTQVAGTWDGVAGAARLQAAGFVNGAGQVACTGDTTLDCLDKIVTHGPLRAALLDPRMRVMGVGARLVEGKVHLVINLAAE